MIFVTVGTHEQPFNRLVESVDILKGKGKIDEDVVIQTGYSTYNPQYCKWAKLLPYNEMMSNVERAHIVITHGGPASFIMPLQIGKIPIVVPRKFEFDEHVNNHQVDFAEAVSERMGNIIPVFEICDLERIIFTYDALVNGMNANMVSNNMAFCNKLDAIVQSLFEKK